VRYLFGWVPRRSGTIRPITLPFCCGFSENGYDSIAYVTLLSGFLDDRVRFNRLRYPSMSVSPRTGSIQSLALPLCSYFFLKTGTHPSYTKSDLKRSLFPIIFSYPRVVLPERITLSYPLDAKMKVPCNGVLACVYPPSSPHTDHLQQ